MSVNVEAYKKAHAAYKALAADPAKRADKTKAHLEVLAMEREAARSGVHLEAGVKVSEGGDTKRSLQEEYCRKFDDEIPVKLAAKVGEEPKETTLRKYHKQRLGV